MSVLGDRLSTRRIAIGVAAGVLLAAGVIFGLWRASQPSEFDCSIQRSEYLLGDRAAYDVDDACL